MSFAKSLNEKFSVVFDRSEYHSADPIVRLQYVAKGNNIVLGRTIKDEDFSKLAYLGKVIENTVGKNYLSADLWLDTTFPHVIYISGTRGSGKSFDLGVILEGISDLANDSNVQNDGESLCSVLIDTQSQFWTLKYPPNPAIAENASQIRLLEKWNISPNSLSNCRILVPKGTEKITGDEAEFQICANQIEHDEWCALIKEDVYGPQGHILAQTLEALEGTSYSLEAMLSYIADDGNWSIVAESSRNAVTYKLDDYRRTGLFGSAGLVAEDFLVPGRCTVLMLRDLRNEDKSLVTALVARQMFQKMGEHHKRLKVAKFFDQDYDAAALPSKAWLLIDEAHVVAPSDAPSPARKVLVEYVKRGRDAGLSLVLATQQPSAVDDRILSQVNMTFSHRLTFQQDIVAATNRIPTKLLKNLKFSGVEISNFGDMLRYLEAGQCFIGDHHTSRVILSQIRPRITAHGGYSPI